jgi:putative transposase
MGCSHYTSQTCPNCGVHTGKKQLSERIHTCPECGFSCNRDFAASLVIKNRGLNAVGQPVSQNAFGEVLAGFSVNWAS